MTNKKKKAATHKAHATPKRNAEPKDDGCLDDQQTDKTGEVEEELSKQDSDATLEEELVEELASADGV